MPKIKIDSIEYNTEDLSEKGQATFKSLQFLELQLQRLNSEIAVYNTAHGTYVAVLKAEIRDSGIEPISAEEISEE